MVGKKRSSGGNWTSGETENSVLADASNCGHLAAPRLRPIFLV